MSNAHNNDGRTNMGEKSKQSNRAEAAGVEHDVAMEGGMSLMGKWVSVETADPIYHGRVVGESAAWIVLAEASWVADAGRKHTYAKDPKNRSESEYIGSVWIERPVVAVILHPAGTDGALETK